MAHHEGLITTTAEDKKDFLCLDCGKLTQNLRARICDKCLYFNPKFYLSVFETASTCPALTFTSSLFWFEIISPSVISLSNHLHDLRLFNVIHLPSPQPIEKPVGDPRTLGQTCSDTHLCTYTHSTGCDIKNA